VKNPNSEYRNPKQIRMIKIKITETRLPFSTSRFSHSDFEFWTLFRISDFDIRISCK